MSGYMRICYLTLLVACLSLSSLNAFYSGESDLDSVLDEAEAKLQTAYVAVLQAEKSGGNVTFLVTKLSVAASLLADARNAYRIRRYEDAYHYAVSCCDMLDGVVEEAEIIRAEAIHTYNKNMYWAITESSIALVLLVLCSVFGWRFLKKWYFRRLLNMRPEVGENR